MPDPYLIGCLVELRGEFNKENPDRDKGADGWIGDIHHQNEVSDHNPDSQGRVLAIDIDSTGPWPHGLTLDDYVNYIVGECQAGREYRIEYIIRNRKIYERHNGYRARDYTGSDPHENHAHFSARHDHAGENDKGVWFMLSGTDRDWISQEIQNSLADFFQFPTEENGKTYVRKTVSDIGLMESRRQAMEDRLTAAITGKTPTTK